MAPDESFIAPSLLRVPFLLILMVMSHISTARPNRAPDDTEQRSYEKGGQREAFSVVMGWFIPTVRVLIQVLNLCDLYVSISMAYPSIQIPALLDILLPFNHHASSATIHLRVTPLFILGTAICSFGSLLRLACYRHLGRYFTLELALLKDHRLITDGPYAYVRHPAYLGAVGFCSGLLIYQHSAGSWWAEAHIWSSAWGKVVGVVWLSYVMFCIVSVVFIRVAKEDEVLRSSFGDQWVEWSKRTPYKIFPGIY